jgi:O-antigen/teichoic acid export membrane protein
MFAGLAPLVLSHICEGIFQGWERMDLVALVNLPICLLKILAVFVAAKLDLGILGVVGSLTASQVVVMILQWLVLMRLSGMPQCWFRISTALEMVQASSVFFGIQAVNSFKSSVTVVVLSKLESEFAVGVYAAASQLLAPASLILSSVAFSLFPAMCRGFDRSKENLIIVVRNVVAGMMLLAIPAVVGLFMLSQEVLLLIYRDSQFLGSASVLRVIVWTLLASVFTSIIGQSFWASSREKLALRIAIANILVQMVSSLVLIHFFGVMGAAYSALMTALVNLIQHVLPAAKPLSEAGLLSAIWRPALAAGVMALFVEIARDSGLFREIVGAVLVYGVVLVGLLVWQAGGLKEFRASCYNLWAA